MTGTEKIKMMGERIRLVKKGGQIKILCGEGNHKVYNQQCIIDAFRYAKDEKEAKIQIVIGPVVLTDSEGKNGLLELEKEGKIDKIFYRPQRGALFHFGVFEKEGTKEGSYSFLDIELPHRCLARDEERREPNFPLEDKEAEDQFWADKFSIDFDHWVDELSQNPSKEGIPIKITDGQLESLLASIKEADKDFDFLEAEELLMELAKLK